MSLFRYLHALFNGRHAEELPPVRMSFLELWRADYTRLQVPTILEVGVPTRGNP